MFGMRRRDEDGLQMWKQRSKPARQDFTDHWGREDHSWEDYYSRTSEWENYWDKPKYNRWEENDYNEHQMNADVYREYCSTHSHGNDRQNPRLDKKPFIQWSCEIYACIITVALFLFLVAFTIF